MSTIMAEASEFISSGTLCGIDTDGRIVSIDA
jgi:hypothetical protein